jgi:hypothetical protein
VIEIPGIEAPVGDHEQLQLATREQPAQSSMTRRRSSQDLKNRERDLARFRSAAARLDFRPRAESTIAVGEPDQPLAVISIEQALRLA